MARVAGLAGGLAGGLAACGAAWGWDAPGHRAVTWLALDGLPADAPAFLREPDVRHAVAWQAAEPDRWRGTRPPRAPGQLASNANPDHFIDIEDLGAFGMTLETIPPLRSRYLRDMAIARHKEPAGPGGAFEPYNAARDPLAQQEWPGFGPHAVMEHYARLISSFRTLRILEKLNDPARGPQVVMARANIQTTMGVLSHYVGDLAQPLHTTKHYNGWKGENPQGYTTRNTIHAYIDGGVVRHHGLNYATLKPTQAYTVQVTPADPWLEVLAFIRRSHAEVEAVYAMEKSGELQEEAGRALITARLNDAAAMLAALYGAAWEASAPAERDVTDFLRYDGFDAAELPEADAEAAGGAPRPAAEPAPAAAPAAAP